MYFSLIFYPSAKAEPLSPDASHTSLPNERPGLGGCDVTDRFIKSTKSVIYMLNSFNFVMVYAI